MSVESMNRKARSEKILKENNALINFELPPIEDSREAAIKSPEEIVRRAVAALLTTQIAMECLNYYDGDGNNDTVMESAGFFREMLESFDLEDELTEDEERYFELADDDEELPTEKEASDMSWRVEMCLPLFWACGLVEELPYPDEESEYVLELSQTLSSCDDFDDIMDLVEMRSDGEILDEADLIFRMDWACVEAWIKQEKPSGNLSLDVVVERHKGFNWIIGAYDAEDWDNVVANT